MAEMVPLELTEKLVPLMTLVPLTPPKVKVPVPLANKEKLLFKEEVVIMGEAPVKVRLVEFRVSLLKVPAVMLPVLSTFKPPFEAMVRVPLVLPIPILLVPAPKKTLPEPVTLKLPAFWE